MAEGKKEKKGKKEKDKDAADKRASKDKVKDKDKEKDKDKDKDKEEKEDKKDDDDMSAVILKGLDQLNELVKTIEEQVAEYIKRKGPLEMTEQYCSGPITNCGPSCLISSFQSNCQPGASNNCKPVQRACPPQNSFNQAPRCPCCGTTCTTPRSSC